MTLTTDPSSPAEPSGDPAEDPAEDPSAGPDGGLGGGLGDTDGRGDDSPSWQQRRAARQAKTLEARRAWRASGVGYRVLPRTLLGVCVTLVAFALGAGSVGAALFVYYDARVSDYQEVVTNAADDVARRTNEGVAAIEEVSRLGAERLAVTLGPYASLLQGPSGVPRPGEAVSPALAQVRTASVDGAPVAGSAVAVGRTDDGVVLVTSLRLVEAAAAEPGPAVELVVRGEAFPARVWSTSPDLELAVLVADVPLEVATFAPVDDVSTATGAPVFAVSAYDTATTPGAVVAVAASGVRHTAATSDDFAGGPVVDAAGRVVAFSAPGYLPNGVGGGAVPWSPTIKLVCEALLRCDGTSSEPR